MYYCCVGCCKGCEACESCCDKISKKLEGCVAGINKFFNKPFSLCSCLVITFVTIPVLVCAVLGVLDMKQVFILLAYN